MAIRKQNAALLFFVVIVLAGLGYVLVKEGKLSQFYSEQAVDEEGNPIPAAEIDEQSALGDSVDSASGSPGTLEKQKTFATILDDLSDCLDIKSAEASDAAPVGVDSIISLYQSELGAAKGPSDRWMNWHLRNRDGKEKRLRLEVKEDENGRPLRELHYFSVDRSGQPTSIDLEDARRDNPSDDTITAMLREGEVFYKDRSAFVTFSSGERIEFVEKNGELSEIEFIKGESFFRCGDLESRENCQCTK